MGDGKTDHTGSILFAAATASHIYHFMLPFMEMMSRAGYAVDVLAGGDHTDEKLAGQPYIRRIDHIPFSRNPFDAGNARVVRTLRRLLRERRYDVIHTNTPVASFLMRIAARNLGGTRIVYMAHGFHFYRGAPLRNWLIYYPAEWLASRLTHDLITINREDYDLARRRFRRCRVHYLPGTGVDLERFRPDGGTAPDEHALLCVAEFIRRKNHRQIVRALPYILAEEPEAQVWFAGTGPLLEPCRAEARRLGVEGHIRFLGFRYDVPELISRAGAAVLASVHEGVPRFLLEAMACGKPIVATGVRGSRELVAEGENGHLVAVGDARGLARACLSALKSPGRERMGEKSLQMCLRYGLEHIKPALRDIYTGELGSRRIALYMAQLGGYGVEKLMAALARGLSGLCGGVEVAACNGGGSASFEAGSLPGVVVHDLGCRLGHGDMYAVLSLFRLIRFLRRERPDALLAAPGWCGACAALARRLGGAAVKIVPIVDAPISPLRRGRWHHRLQYVFSRLLFPGAEAIVVPTEAVRLDLLRHTAVRPGRVFLIPHPVIRDDLSARAGEPVDPGCFSGLEEAVKFLYVGRLSPEKGIFCLLEAFERVRTAIPAALLLVGTGPQREEIERWIDGRRLRERVRMLGYRVNPFPYYRRCDVTVVPSLREAFGMTIVEALALGCPVVAARAAGGGPESILDHGRYGMLCRAGDAGDLAEKMLACRRYPWDREQLTSRGMQYRAERSIAQYARRLRIVTGE